MIKNWKKFTAEKNLIFFKNKNCTIVYFSLGLHKGHLSYGRSLQPSKEKENI
jgi:hypothetical protein